MGGGRILVDVKKQEPFGDNLVINIPCDCDMIIVSKNKGYGLVPVMFLLPHQLYVHTLNEIIKKDPQITSITITPIKSCNHFDVWKYEFDWEKKHE